MIKLSFSASKVLLGLSLGAILYSNAFGADDLSAYLSKELNTIGSNSNTIDINDGNIESFFEQNGDTYEFKNANYKDKDLTINVNTWKFDEIGDQEKVKIDLGNGTLTLNNEHNTYPNSTKEPALVRNFNITAKEIKAKDISFNVYAPSTINGDFSMNSDSDEFTTENPDMKVGSSLFIYNGTKENGTDAVNGSLTVNGNFSAEKTLIASLNSDTFKINGTAILKDSGIGILKLSYRDLEANNFIAIRANEIKLEGTNETGAMLLKNASSYIRQDLLKGEDYGVYIDIANSESEFGSLVDYKYEIKNCGNSQCFVINGGATEQAKDLLTQAKVDKQTLDQLIKATENEDEFENKDAILEELQKQKTDLEKLIEEATTNGDKIDDNKYLDLVAPDLKNNISDKNAVMALRDIADQLGSIGADLASREGIELALNIKKDTDNTGKSVSNLNSASNATNTTINISNDLSITSRVAMLNNPYGSYASRLSKLKFASNDLAGNYIDDYKNSVWANVFGGTNIIDGDSGSMYGASVGADKRVNDDVLLGFYFTYANSTIKDNGLEQESDNFQLGLYSTINIAPQVELSLRAYAQLSPTDQSNISTTGLATADFTNKFFGLSANVGRVFDFSDNTLFIKPFAGVNYYLSHTPSYTETNNLGGFDIASMTNHSLSLELGAEFRKYMSESSYLFITPKIEQFVLNSGDDFSANLSVNNAFFTSIDSADKKKTYAQVVLGGNLDLNERLSLNAGIGAKQILAGKVDNKNETYVSGQIGFKYKF